MKGDPFELGVYLKSINFFLNYPPEIIDRSGYYVIKMDLSLCESPSHLREK